MALLATEFPWDITITAVSTLTAGLGAAWFTGRQTARAERVRWRLDRQAEVAAKVLEAWASFYLDLAKAATDDRTALSDSGEWIGPLVSTDRWNQALESMALVGESHLVSAAHQLDSEMWRMSSRISHLGALANDEWLEDTRAGQTARIALVNAARRVLGVDDYNSLTWGKPPPDDPSWSAEHWKSERRRILQARRDRAGSANPPP